jgi:hypothetical protein
MIGSRKLVVGLAMLGVAASAIGCSGMSDGAGSEQGEDGVGEVGNLALALNVGDDVTLHAVDWDIAGPHGFSRSGHVNVRHSRDIRFQVGGLPAGNGFEIVLNAVGENDERITCTGSAQFDISAGETTTTTVILTCRMPRRNGSVVVNGELNLCPWIDEVTVLPTQVAVGGTIELTGSAVDEDGVPSPLTYQWSATGGELSASSGPGVTLTCTEPGTIELTFTADDGDCTDVVSTSVECTEPEQDAGAALDAGGAQDGGSEGQAILLWNEVESNGGTPDDWSELYNAGDAAQDLSGWTFKDGDDTHVYNIPAGTIIAPGEYLILEGYGFGLGDNDSIRLFDPGMNLIASYSWGPHAQTTYGRCPDVEGEFTTTSAPTKGAPNDCRPIVVFNEVESSGGTPGDWAEIYNAGFNTADLSGYTFKDNQDADIYVLPAGSTIPVGGYLVLDEADFDFGLGGADSVRLFDPEMNLVADYSWLVHAPATSYGRCPNGVGAFETTAATTKGAANSCPATVRLNEIESSGGVPGDWVEIVNVSAASVDVSGWVFKDGVDTNAYSIPAGTSIASGAFLVLDEAQFGFGLGGNENIRLYNASAVLVDSYAYTSAASNTYGRCPDGTGGFINTLGATKGTTNNCPIDPSVPQPWAGGSTVQTVDPTNAFPTNLSGLTYQPAEGVNPPVLWGALNSPSKIYRLVWDGVNWAPEAGPWATGKLITYPWGGQPDTEGITKAEWNQVGTYVATERNNESSSTSRLAVLRLDETAIGGTLTASHEWNLTAQLPVVGANLGLEAITWIPDSYLTASGFYDELAGQTYNPAAYADHGTGLFVVGVEGTGMLYVLALDHTTSLASIVASVSSGFPGVMGLEFDRDNNHLWTWCDDTCGNQGTILQVDTTAGSPTLGKLVVRIRYNRPSGLPNSNFEGIAIAPESECSGGQKSVFWADDANMGGNAIRRGSLTCGSLF